MISATLIRPPLVPLVRQGLSGKSDGVPSAFHPLRVRFEDAALTITPQRPKDPARFAVTFGNGALTITS